MREICRTPTDVAKRVELGLRGLDQVVEDIKGGEVFSMTDFERKAYLKEAKTLRSLYQSALRNLEQGS